jgi:RecA-family ATPase
MRELALTAPFEPLSLDALFALELPETEYVVEEILPQGALFLLSAREKAGKGLLAIDLCASVAFGEPFLDRAVLEGPAIYCAAEERIQDVRDRVAARVGDRRDAPLLILPLDGSTEDRLRLEDPDGLQRLAYMISEFQPRLVVLDTLRELHNCHEDFSDEMGPLLRPIRQMAHGTNTTIGLNHHHNRAGSFRGSTAILAACDLG